MSLLQAKESLSRLSFKKPGEIAGVTVVADALEEPLRQLVINNGLDPSEVLKKIKRSKATGAGFNSETSNVQDLGTAGIIDPVGTVTRAVQLAFSHARTILLTGAWDATAPVSDKRSSNTIRGPLVELTAEEESQGSKS